MKFPPNLSRFLSHLGADLVAALPGLDVDDLAHAEEVLLVDVFAKKSSLEETAVFSSRATRSNWNDGRPVEEGLAGRPGQVGRPDQ